MMHFLDFDHCEISVNVILKHFRILYHGRLEFERKFRINKTIINYFLKIFYEKTKTLEK